jgi:Zn-dependent protease
MKDLPHDAETEAYVGLGGPLVGTLGALACYFAARDGGPEMKWLLAVSYSGFFLNLFNMIPMSPLDGGRITAVLSPRIWLLGVPVMIGLFVMRPNPTLLIVALLAAPQVVKAWKYRAGDPSHGTYYQTSLEDKLTYGTAYLGLLAFLAVMTHDVHEMIGAARP